MADERCWNCDAGMQYVCRIENLGFWLDLVGCRYCIEFFVGPYHIDGDGSALCEIKVTSIVFWNRWRSVSAAEINLPAPYDSIKLGRDTARIVSDWIKQAASGIDV